MLTKVEELPDSRGGGSETYTARDVREFQRRHFEVARVEIKGKPASNIRASCRSYIKAKGIEGVDAVVRQGACYLVRTAPESNG